MLYFTNSYKEESEGFSTHYWERISAIIVAELNKRTFVYTPLQGVSHNYDGDIDFIKKKEQLMNLINHFPVNTNLNFQRQCADSSAFFFNNVEYCYQSNAFSIIKKLFYLNKSRERYFSNDCKHIAIHIRKCNPHDVIPPTELSEDRYFGIVTALRSSFCSEPIKFHIYSQGLLIKEQEYWKADDIVLHIDESIEDTFTSMVFADVLVTCQSGFSRLAGYLSNGLIIYPREVVTPLNVLPHFKII